MSRWPSLLKPPPLDWLRGEDNPSVRYLTLTGILDQPETDAAVKEAKAAIMTAGTVPAILAKQNPAGYWGSPQDFYTAKYKGTVWQLLVLAELQADGRDERILRACEFILENSQSRESGGFAYRAGVRAGGGRESGVIPCLTGNMVWALIRLGFPDDDRVRRGIDWLATHQRFDDGDDKAPRGGPYTRLKTCFGGHSCHMGVVKALKALAEVPPAMRTRAVNDALDRGVEYLLIHRIHKKSRDPSQVSKPGWLRLGFPLMYQADVLEILGILTRLGCRDERMTEALEAVIRKQGDDGKWLLESTFNGRFLVSVERKGKPSKWITLHALRVLKRLHGGLVRA